ncbi:putative GntR-family transcriptional regulator [Actinoplanes missouriensis 431]|uniref:Putative GntR-family transcriptional regulator n=1 Tax=Actinoplanes missouriensis (strain ATCC 14538 / DSM 43046 / CBS 188.64 / JCM 3121 / NBRC 102363 / NCIMB 12654 / NRRL B-3342 / UNCC 431) TaxID=512565 RepID=I0H317_ACTM4|nr:GntR family transcriptional regulator [Actinoplanes missouriensis]BAL87404.1 putative GntR-family transcriptional regulator [Actinoplanes missouriensis 431]
MESVGRHLLRDAAYGRLRGAIVDGTLAPGLALKPDDLAEQLGLSRAPIRDALARLAADGLVETKPQSYTRVTEVVPKEVEDAAAVVGAMHALAVQSIARRMTTDQLERMREANARFAAAVAAGDVEAALAADDDVHAIPLHGCGNAAAAATAERYTPLVRRAERLLFTSPQASRSVRLHDELIDALAARDAARAIAVNAEIWGHLHHSVNL